MKPILLGVNIDHIATVRQARGTDYPSILQAAKLAEKNGADGITVHLREDRRHIQDDDVVLLAKSVTTKLNLEMALTEEMLEIALKLKPQCVCLVPEKREELTTEGGLEVLGQKEKVSYFVERLSDAGIEVSLFIDPDISQIEAAAEVKAPVIEIHTGEYAEDPSDANLQRIQTSVDFAVQKGLVVNAGHGLHDENIEAIAAISDINELNIGHSIVAKALMVGLPSAVSITKALMNKARA